jgi:hypothetical protein
MEWDGYEYPWINWIVPGLMDHNEVPGVDDQDGGKNASLLEMRRTNPMTDVVVVPICSTSRDASAVLNGSISCLD